MQAWDSSCQSLPVWDANPEQPLVLSVKSVDHNIGSPSGLSTALAPTWLTIATMDWALTNWEDWWHRCSWPPAGPSGHHAPSRPGHQSRIRTRPRKRTPWGLCKQG